MSLKILFSLLNKLFIVIALFFYQDVNAQSFTLNDTLQAQDFEPELLTIGDPAPAIKIGKWLKGVPIQKFEAGKIYVFEFWATWCIPCIAAMPHLSELARIYHDKITVVGIDIHEKNTTSVEKVRRFVDSMGSRMDYLVATDSNNFMADNWILPTGIKGIPKTFVVNGNGKLAWIGHPSKLDKVLPKIINNEWDVAEELAKQNEKSRLANLDDSLRWDLIDFSGDHNVQNYIGKPDSALLMINRIIEKETKLKYAHFIAEYTFQALLKTDPDKAYEYGMEALNTNSDEEEIDVDFIINNIKYYSDKLHIPDKLYELGAMAYQVKIDQITYPEIASLYKYYSIMATWYWQAKNKPKAIEALQKAIDNLKSKNDF
ncbi:MAG: TlpA disulfide reductase family protein [Chitinophagaceae bacterium]